MKDWPTNITALVALYGAILSTFNHLSQRKERQRRVTVRLSNAFLSNPAGVSPTMLSIEASNPGHLSINLNSPGILFPDKRSLVFPHPQGTVNFPHDLAPGNNCTVWIEMKKVAHNLHDSGFKGKINLIGFYRDGIGKQYKSRKFKFNIDEWKG